MLVLAAGGIGLAAKAHHDDVVSAQLVRQPQQQLASSQTVTDTPTVGRAGRKARLALFKRDMDLVMTSLTVHSMEKAVTRAARQKVEAGIWSGPILGSRCAKAPGTAAATAIPYSCTAITSRNDDGTVRGHNVPTTLTIKSGSYRFRLGRQ